MKYINKYKDYKKKVLLKSETFFDSLPDNVKKLNELFKSNNYELVIVGGAVRDFLSGKTVDDYDLATNAIPRQIIEMVHKIPNITTSDVGISNGVTFLYYDSIEFEIATYRKDKGTTRKNNTVEFVKNISDDFQRRDLTINSLYYDISTKNIIDYTGGIADLNKKIIRTVGDSSKRFSEDESRKLRAIRFAGKTNANLSNSVKKALIENPSLQSMSQQSKLKDFKKGIKQVKNIETYLKDLNRFGLLGQILPNKNLNIIESIKDLNNNYLIIISSLLVENEIDLSYLMNELKLNKKDSKMILYLLKCIEFDFEYMLKNKKDLIYFNREVEQFLNSFGYDLKQIKNFKSFNIKKNKSEITKDLINNYNIKGKELGLLINQKILELFKNKIK